MHFNDTNTLPTAAEANGSDAYEAGFLVGLAAAGELDFAARTPTPGTLTDPWDRAAFQLGVQAGDNYDGPTADADLQG